MYKKKKAAVQNILIKQQKTNLLLKYSYSNEDNRWNFHLFKKNGQVGVGLVHRGFLTNL